MNIYWFLYFAIGLVIAIRFYKTESSKVKKIDEPIANITTLLVYMFWPVVALVWLIKLIIKWLQIH